MTRTRYAYVPFNRAATPESDAVRLDSRGLLGGPAGRLICTIDGTDPSETYGETLDGRYAMAVTRRDAERAFGRDHVDVTRDEANDAVDIY